MTHILLVLALFMHGVGHILFVANAWGYWKSSPGHAALFSQVLHAGPTVEGVFGLLWLIPTVAFLSGTWGFMVHGEGWQPMLLTAAVVSSVLLLVWWGSLNTSSAFFALVFNIIVVAVVLWQRQGMTITG